MTEYTYGPWQVHTGDECPVPPDTLVQVQLRNQSQVSAKEFPPNRAEALDWDAGDQSRSGVAYYRIVTPVEPEARVMTGFFSGRMEVVVGRDLIDFDQFRITFPEINGKPDFTRQPTWEPAE